MGGQQFRWVWRSMVIAGYLAASMGGAVRSSEAAQPASCSVTSQTVTAKTSVGTIGEAYTCLLAHYPTGATLDDRVLLQGAMAGVIGQLVQDGLDQPTAVLPELSGDRAVDWQAFRRNYGAIVAHLPRDGHIQEHLAQAAIAGMAARLHDDHTRYAPPESGDDGRMAANGAAGLGDFGLGIRLSIDMYRGAVFIVRVDGGSPAAHVGLRQGDSIQAINGLPPCVGGVADPAILAQLDGPGRITLVVLRPVDGHVIRVTVAAAAYPAPQPVTARVLPGDIGYVQLTSFTDNAANYVIAALDGLGLGRNLHGVVLDLRGNEGGSAAEPAHLLGAFVHDRVFAYLVDGHGHRTAMRTDANLPLLGVPLVALIDQGCASACDVTASAIHDLHLGRLVGERTAGDAAGPATQWYMHDGGILQIPVAFMRGAKGEIVDGIGVPPDDSALVTAADLSAGRDPGIDRALRDLRRQDAWRGLWDESGNEASCSGLVAVAGTIVVVLA